ncbi:hypothetical protein [Microlunatus ginsengisoli]|uniref:Uncharacterized protein n=1 Tax=Microlunatus ginsengisoli TaxID=363863 RepID=A0ABP7AM94_9ACTN
MSGPDPARLYLDATPVQRARLDRAYLARSADLIGSALAALNAAGLDTSVPDATGTSGSGTGVAAVPVPEAVRVAEVAVRHRHLVGRLPGFGPDAYAEMVAAIRAVFGELHPDDVGDLAPFDLWAVQDRHTGEPLPGVTGAERNRARRAVGLLRRSAADAIT